MRNSLYTVIEDFKIEEELGIDLKIKRDDLFPLCGGGNKARKAFYILEYAKKNGYNYIVTNGGIQSNHARAIALLAAKNNIKCHLVLHTNEKKEISIGGNLLLMFQSGAKIEFCLKDELSHFMDRAIEKHKKEGFNPLYIWGGGHCLEGSLAFYDAAIEAQKQCGNWTPDYIILPSGTGTTQAGLIAGYKGFDTKIIGISVARDKERGRSIICNSLNELNIYLNSNATGIIDFRDDWILGGYESTNERLFKCIDDVAKNGLILDPTYTGKAFMALTDLIKNGEIDKGSKVLFWHTGGLLNLLSSERYLNRILL